MSAPNQASEIAAAIEQIKKENPQTEQEEIDVLLSDN